MFKFKTERVNFEEKLTGDSISHIYPYQKSPSDDAWIVKEISIQGADAVLSFMEGIVVGYSCDHPAILPIDSYYIDKVQPSQWNVYTKLPRMQTNLKNIMQRYIKDKSAVPEKDIVKCFYTLACGLEYLHENKQAAHRSINPNNVLFDRNGNIKLAEINMTRDIAAAQCPWFSKEMAEKESSLYIAPEILEKKPITKKSQLFQADMWSLGILISELGLLSKKSTSSFDLVITGQELKSQVAELDKKFNKKLIELVLCLLSIDPNERKSARDVKIILEENFKNYLNDKSKEEEKEQDIMIGQDSAENPENILTESQLFKVLKSQRKEEAGQLVGALENIKKELRKGELASAFKFDVDRGLNIEGIDVTLVNDNALAKLLKYVQETLTALKYNSLESLEINLRNCEQVTDHGFQNICTGIGVNFPKLKRLALNLSGCIVMTDNGLRELGHLSLAFKNLEYLSLNFAACKQLSNQGVEEVFKLIGAKCRNLVVLSLDFTTCPKITNQVIEGMISSLGPHFAPSLQGLELKFVGCSKISDSAVKKLGPLIMNNFKELKKLGLYFAGCPDVSNDSVKEISAAVTAKGSNIKDLTLDFVGCKINDKTKLAVTITLSVIPHLNILF